MSSRREELASYVKLAPEGLSLLAGMLDESIKESVRMRSERRGRKNGNVLHGLIREGVILAAKDSDRLAESGITVRARNSDGIEVRIKDADVVLKLTHRPQNARPADSFLMAGEDLDVLFPVPRGHLRLFYTMSGEGIGRLTLSRTLSEPRHYFRDCQILEEVAIPPVVDLARKMPAAAQASRNDDDDLSDLIQAKHSNITIYGEGTLNAETGGEAADVG